MPSIVSGAHGSSVLVDGSPCVPATAAGLAVGTTATGAAVGATLEAAVPIGVADGATEAAGVAVAVAAGAGVVVGPGTGWHELDMKVSVSRMTAPFRAKVLPSMVTPVVTVMEVRARIVPTNREPVPKVAELVTCQKTLHALAPLMSLTELVEPVVRVDGDLKIQTELGSFWPFRVTFPLKSVVRLDNE